MNLFRHHIMDALILPVVLIFALAGCSESANIDSASRQEIELLRLGILPDLNEEELRARISPLTEYLSAELQIPVELVVPTSYENLLDLFGSAELELAYLGGYTFVVAHLQYDAQPLVMRQKDRSFTTYVIVRNDHPAQSIEDLRGATFSFGSKLSTSGHLMPRHYFEDKKIVAEEFFSQVQYSATHDGTIRKVLDEVVAAGAANGAIVENFLNSDSAEADQIKIVWQSPAYTDYVWAIQSNTPKEIVEKIGRAFLRLERTGSTHKAILDGLDADFYLSASLSDFDTLKTIIEKKNGGE